MSITGSIVVIGLEVSMAALLGREASHATRRRRAVNPALQTEGQTGCRKEVAVRQRAPGAVVARAP
jgi:hypothetical protein